jgi:hypothetical protein
MRSARKPACRKKVLAAAIWVVCCGGLIRLSGWANLGRPQGPPLPGSSAFGKSLPQGFRWPDSQDVVGWRVLAEYGALFVSRGDVVLPPVVIFPDQDSVVQWQATLSAEQEELDGIGVRLQSAAMRALLEARQEAQRAHLDISPRGRDAAQRSYDETVTLWRSRVDPGLQHWVAKGLLSADEAGRIRKTPAREQVVEILELEKRGLYFSKDFARSILSSVAPPGASQHLALLAFDVKQHDNAVVRSILERHGWFQTVRSDLPHFTYLGVKRQVLPSLGLELVRTGGREYWVPNVCATGSP